MVVVVVVVVVMVVVASCPLFSPSPLSTRKLNANEERAVSRIECNVRGFWAPETLAQKPLKISVEGGGAVSVRGAGLPLATTQWHVESTALEKRLAAVEAAPARKDKDLERAQRCAAEQGARISRLERQLEMQTDGRYLALSGYHRAVSERAALDGAHEAGAEEAARAAAAAQAAHEAELADTSSVTGAFCVVSGAVAQVGGPDV